MSNEPSKITFRLHIMFMVFKLDEWEVFSLSLSPVPNPITHLTQTYVFEWCMVRCRYKNIHQKGMHSKKNWLCPSHLLGLLYFRFNSQQCMSLRGIIWASKSRGGCFWARQSPLHVCIRVCIIIFWCLATWATERSSNNPNLQRLKSP